MSLDKAIESGKEHRKKYRGAKAVDSTCRNHGSDLYDKSNRTYKNNKRLMSAMDRELIEMEGETMPTNSIFHNINITSATEAEQLANVLEEREKQFVEGNKIQKKYIDAELLMHDIQVLRCVNSDRKIEAVTNQTIHELFPQIVNDALAADVVEIVRCKDCKWYKTEFCAMYDNGDDGWNAGWKNEPNDYCNRGERETNG